MNISDKEREFMKNYIKCRYNCNPAFKDEIVVVEDFINNVSYEEAQNILEKAKKYPDFRDIDKEDIRNVIKVVFRYINKIIGVYNNHKFPNSDMTPDYSMYVAKAKYYAKKADELINDEINSTKIKVIVDAEGAFWDFEELSNCQGLEAINAYIRKNIVKIVGKAMYYYYEKNEECKKSFANYSKTLKRKTAKK